MARAVKDDDGLKLGALDADDLAVISAHLQDAVLKAGDMVYRRAEQRFAVLVNRLDWAHAVSAAKGPWRRRRCVLSFDRVGAVQTRGVRRDRDDAVLSLLAIRFEPVEPPGGTITLVFSGGPAVRLTVECIEARLYDLGAVWETGSLPRHDLDDTAGEAAG